MIGRLPVVYGEAERMPVVAVVGKVEEIVKEIGISWVAAAPVVIGVVFQLVIKAVQNGKQRLSSERQNLPKGRTDQRHHDHMTHPGTSLGWVPSQSLGVTTPPRRRID